MHHEAPRSKAERIIVPTERHVERLGSGRVVSLARFLGAHVDPSKKPASVAARRLALLKAADELSEGNLAIRVPSDPAARIAFAAAVDVTIGGLLSSDCSHDVLSATRTPRGIATAALAARQAELLARERLYDVRGLAGSVDVGDAESELCFYGSADLSPQVLGLALRLHTASRRRGGRGVTISLPRLDLVPDPSAPIAESIERRYAEEPDAPEIEWREAPSSPAVDVVDAASPEAEARAAVAAIVRALEGGASIDRIAIAIPQESESLLEALRATLGDAKIAYSEARGRAATRAPEVRALLSLTAMASARIERDRVIELLRTPGLHAGSWVDARSEADADKRALVLAHRLRELPLSADRDGTLFVDAVKRLTPAPEDAWMGEAARRIVQAVDTIRAVTGRKELAQALVALRHRLRLGEPSAAELSKALRDETNGGAVLALEAIGEGAVALRAAMLALEEIDRAAQMFDMDRARGGLDELSAELLLDLDRASTAARGASPRAGAVRITSPREIAGIAHDLVVVMGLGARAYGGEGSSDPWLDELTLSRIPSAMRPRSVRERRAVRHAELAWSMAWSTRVLLTRSATDDEGREAEPAHEIVVRALESGASYREEPASRVSPRASITSPRSLELTQLAAGTPPAPELWARVGIERDRSRFFLDPRLSGGAFTGRIPERQLHDLSQRVGGRSVDETVSVSTIERAAGCPFRAFAGRVLGARRAEDALETASARDRGTLLHRALYVAYETKRELPPSISEDELMARVEAAIRLDFGVEGAMSPLFREVHSLIVRDALAVLSDELAHPSHLSYFVGERRFGRGEHEPFGPLELAGDAGLAVFVDGQIDRVDRSTDGKHLLVIDYKTGKPPSRKAIGDTVFQLPLYAAAAKRAYGGEEVTGLYLSVRPGGSIERSPTKPAESVLSDDELLEVGRRAANVVGRLWGGDIAPRPSHPKQCLRCEARDLCRRPAVLPKSDGAGEEVDAAPMSVPS